MVHPHLQRRRTGLKNGECRPDTFETIVPEMSLLRAILIEDTLESISTLPHSLFDADDAQLPSNTHH